MTAQFTEETLRSVLAALPNEPPGVPPRDVKVGLAPSTVRHALRELVRTGAATFEGPDSMRRYWAIARGDA